MIFTFDPLRSIKVMPQAAMVSMKPKYFFNFNIFRDRIHKLGKDFVALFND